MSVGAGSIKRAARTANTAKETNIPEADGKVTEKTAEENQSAREEADGNGENKRVKQGKSVTETAGKKAKNKTEMAGKKEKSHAETTAEKGEAETEIAVKKGKGTEYTVMKKPKGKAGNTEEVREEKAEKRVEAAGSYVTYGIGQQLPTYLL